MAKEISDRLAAVVRALPLTPASRVLEIGCGPGAAARAVADRLVEGHVLAIDRSARAIEQARSGSAALIATGRLSFRQAAVETFTLGPGEEPFDVAFAVRVGVLDGRHSRDFPVALDRLRAAVRPGGRLFVDGGDPLREIPLRAR
ncbi:class I SAM-dependent methyltransferase [Streptomyces xantholiticus]